jgi:hypothetical protein
MSTQTSLSLGQPGLMPDRTGIGTDILTIDQIIGTTPANPAAPNSETNSNPPNVPGMSQGTSSQARPDLSLVRPVKPQAGAAPTGPQSGAAALQGTTPISATASGLIRVRSSNGSTTVTSRAEFTAGEQNGFFGALRLQNSQTLPAVGHPTSSNLARALVGVRGSVPVGGGSASGSAGIFGQVTWPSSGPAIPALGAELTGSFAYPINHLPLSFKVNGVVTLTGSNPFSSNGALGVNADAGAGPGIKISKFLNIDVLPIGVSYSAQLLGPGNPPDSLYWPLTIQANFPFNKDINGSVRYTYFASLNGVPDAWSVEARVNIKLK